MGSVCLRRIYMKKIISVLLLLAMVLSLCACAGDTVEGEKTMTYVANDADRETLEKLYADRQAYHGEFHNHANTGGTSDGKNSLREWKEGMQYLYDMDFATIVDHKQVLHMRLDDWDNTMFIGGSEAATTITDVNGESGFMHYNMIVSQPEDLENVLNAFLEKFLYVNDHFGYPRFTRKEMMELVKCIQENGGFFTHVHPLYEKYMKSNDPLEYWFGDGIGFEVLCGYYGNMSYPNNMKAREVWIQMLDAGKRVFATSGSDTHKMPSTVSLTTVYSPEQNATAILNVIREGDFTAGPVSIRMAMGENATGSVCSFADQRLVIAVSDFHSKEYMPGHTYRLDLYNETGLVFSQELEDPTHTNYFAIDADAGRRYYRAEVYDVTGDYIFAVGNPIWNSTFYN